MQNCSRDISNICISKSKSNKKNPAAYIKFIADISFYIATLNAVCKAFFKD